MVSCLRFRGRRHLLRPAVHHITDDSGAHAGIPGHVLASHRSAGSLRHCLYAGNVSGCDRFVRSGTGVDIGLSSGSVVRTA
jgi:hypothetical protein